MRLYGSLLLIGIIMGVSPAHAASRIFRCVDGVQSSLVEQGVGAVDPNTMVCDGDGSFNGFCSFVAACPLCRFVTPPCALACFVPPPFEIARVAVGKARAIRGDREILLLRCDRLPVRATHSVHSPHAPHLPR